MNLTRWSLIGITFILVAVFTFNVYIWADEFKHTFSYNGDWISYIMVFVFVMALTGIFKWLLKEEILLTKPRGKKR
jgi:hypothetical protein